MSFKNTALAVVLTELNYKKKLNHLHNHVTGPACSVAQEGLFKRQALQLKIQTVGEQTANDPKVFTTVNFVRFYLIFPHVFKQQKSFILL
jgi:hypothetical protein